MVVMSDSESQSSKWKALGALIRALFIEGLPGTAKPLANAAIDPVSAYLKTRLLDSGILRLDVVDVFRAADDKFLERCNDDVLQQAFRSQPHAELPALERLAKRLPVGMNRAELEQALRDQFQLEWPNSLGDQRLERAAALYADCLDDALVMVEGQRLPTLHRLLVELKALIKESLSRQQVIAQHVGSIPPREREWLRPAPPRPASKLVGRLRPMNELLQLLQPGSRTAITAAVHGAPGVGKTFLAEHLAARVSSKFDGGIVFQRCGYGFRHAQNAMPVLRQWASYAFGGKVLPEAEHVSRESVRALLDGHGAMLIVLDDVWDAQAVGPLIEALPPEACLLVTTRLAGVAERLRAIPYTLDVLSSDEAVALLMVRLGPAAKGQEGVLNDLAKGLGGHALALTIAAGTLQRWPIAKWPAMVQRMLMEPARGEGFESLAPADGESKVGPIEQVLSMSYFDLPEDGRGRFRCLGSFAPDAEFDTHAASKVWACDREIADGQLRAYVESGLLQGGHSDQHWQMHGLLRAYALALLIRNNEHDASQYAHAAHYANVARVLSKERRVSDVPQDYPQIAHAFAWAVEHDATLALDVVMKMAPYQATYQLREDGLVWAQRLQAATLDRASHESVQALTLLGQALDRIAGEPGHTFSDAYRQAIAAFESARQLAMGLGLNREYARITNALASTLRRVGDLPEEHRHGKLLAALTAQEEALSLLAEGDELRARVLNDQAIVLRALSECEQEDRGERLEQARTSYEHALSVLGAEEFATERADIHNNIGNVYRNLADCPGREAGPLLHECLRCYDEALRFRLPDVRPIEHAMTMHNQAKALQLIALLADADAAETLELAQRACDTAVSIRSLGYGGTEVRPAMRTSVRLWLRLSSAIPERSEECLSKAVEALAAVRAISGADLKRSDVLQNAMLDVEVHLRLAESESESSMMDALSLAEAALVTIQEGMSQDPADIVRAAVLRSRIARAHHRRGEATTVGWHQELVAAVSRAERTQSTTLLSEALVEYALAAIELGDALGHPGASSGLARAAVERVKTLASAGALTVPADVLRAVLRDTDLAGY
jgi:hypothetical protein